MGSGTVTIRNDTSGTLQAYQPGGGWTRRPEDIEQGETRTLEYNGISELNYNLVYGGGNPDDTLTVFVGNDTQAPRIQNGNTSVYRFQREPEWDPNGTWVYSKR
ncbi:hypothetical protein TWF730_008418 [Orbilia blumenaviensis]|uniref:Uncharacterized protein n=1 Tax=Orbilia blumenaviensis TaxID=1796055 RepID=A0AAV9V647_9PEZI